MSTSCLLHIMRIALYPKRWASSIRYHSGVSASSLSADELTLPPANRVSIYDRSRLIFLSFFVLSLFFFVLFSAAEQALFSLISLVSGTHWPLRSALPKGSSRAASLSRARLCLFPLLLTPRSLDPSSPAKPPFPLDSSSLSVVYPCFVYTYAVFCFRGIAWWGCWKSRFIVSGLSFQKP